MGCIGKKQGEKVITMNTVNTIVSITDSTAESIFHRFRGVLLNEPFDYIEKAIGIDDPEDGLTPVQQEIRCQVSQIIARLFKSLMMVDAGNERDTLIGMLVRKLIIMQITQLIYSTQNIYTESEQTNQTIKDNLYYLNQVGNA
jgi:hypothetical protein